MQSLRRAASTAAMRPVAGPAKRAMNFQRMVLEIWFDDWQYEVECDIGESAIKFPTVGKLGYDISGVELRYGYHTGRPDLRALIAQHNNVQPNDVCVTSGASEANFIVCNGLLSPGDHCIIEHPTYPSLYTAPRGIGIETELFRLEYDSQYRPDLEKLRSMIRPETKLISMCHPNNPTGSMMTMEEMNVLIDILEQHPHVHCMFDETYRALDFKETLPPAASLHPRFISINSMSKCYGIPGVRIGWVVSQDPEVMKTMLVVREQITITNNAVGEEIATRVLEDKDKFLVSAEQHVGKNRVAVDDWVNGPGSKYVEWVAPVCGVVGFPRFKDSLGLSEKQAEEIYYTLVKKYKTFCIPGRCFELDNRSWRVGFGAHLPELQQGLSNMEKAIEDVLAGNGSGPVPYPHQRM